MTDTGEYAEWPWSIEKDWDYFQSIDLFVEPNFTKKTFRETDLYRAVNHTPDDFFAYFDVYGEGASQICDCFLVPYASGSILLTEKGKEIVSAAIDQEEADFFPVSMATNSRAELTCWFLAPKVEIPCTNVGETSGIKWLVPDILILYFDRMKFIENCLGSKNIVRNAEYPSQILFSSHIIKEVERSGLKGAKFIYGPHRNYYGELLADEKYY